MEVTVWGKKNSPLDYNHGMSLDIQVTSRTKGWLSMLVLSQTGSRAGCCFRNKMVQRGMSPFRQQPTSSDASNELLCIGR